MDPDIPSDRVDSNLQHLWQAYRSIQRRWLHNKHNRALSRERAELDNTIQSYPKQLTQEQWHQIGDKMLEALRSGHTWTLLRHILNPETTRTTQSRKLQRLLHNNPSFLSQFMTQLRSIYIPGAPQTPLPAYLGVQNEQLDTDITQAEFRTALQTIKPG